MLAFISQLSAVEEIGKKWWYPIMTQTRLDLEGPIQKLLPPLVEQAKIKKATG